MLEKAAGLTSGALDAIAELERRVVDVDGGRLKLEWGRLHARSGERIEDLLWWEADELLGFLGFYGSGGTVELAGMVAPEARGRGIGGALLDEALGLCRDRDPRQVLLIVPRHSEAGKRLALRRSGALDHSEHALVLRGDPVPGPHDPRLSLRPASRADVGVIARLIEAGFGEPAGDVAAHLDLGRDDTRMVELSGSAVGTLRVRRDDTGAAIYAFVIDPEWQGRGLGRDALRRVCQDLRADGEERIRLEVDVDNERALTLYTSIGFTPVLTEDYYALPVPGSA